MSSTAQNDFHSFIERILDQGGLLRDVESDLRSEILSTLRRQLDVRIGIALTHWFSKEQLTTIFVSAHPLVAALAIHPDIQTSLQEIILTFFRQLTAGLDLAKFAIHRKGAQQ